MDILCKRLLLFSMVIFLGQVVLGQEKVSKKIAKSYTMTDTGELQLENKYGNINLFGWDKNEVSVTIAVTVTHRKKENAEDLLQRIRPVLRNSDNYVSVYYEIAEKNSGFFANLFEKANPFDFDRSNLQIDYTVYMPKKAELDVINRFGDVIIEDWTGKLKADVEHGDLWVNDNLNRANIDIKFGKLRSKNINYGTVNLKNGELDMEDGKNLKIISSGTEIQINQVRSLELFSNKDEITIEQAGTVYGTLKFTTVQLNGLAKDVDLILKIADFRVSRILDPNVDIAIDQESSEVSLNITDFPHRFEATLEEGLVRLPKSFENVDSRMLEDGKRKREIHATYGNSLNGSISITGKKGVVLLKEL